MALTPLTEMPPAISCGETFSVTLTYGNYPSSTHTAVLLLNLPGVAPISTAGTTSGTGFNFLVSAATTAAATAGTYSYIVRVTETASGQKAVAEGGVIELLADLGSTVSKTALQTQLDNVNATLSALLSKKEKSVKFNGQEVTLLDVDKLLDLQQKLRTQVFEEQMRLAGLRGAQMPTRAITPNFSRR